MDIKYVTRVQALKRYEIIFLCKFCNISDRLIDKYKFLEILTLTRQLRRKLRMRWFFDVSKVKESSFFKSDLTDPPSDFWCASFGKYQFKPFQLSFFSWFYIKIMLWVRRFLSLLEPFYLKKLFFQFWWLYQVARPTMDQLVARRMMMVTVLNLVQIKKSTL